MRTEQEKLKRIIYESLSPRRKKFIERIGYENWDPFQEPKDPRKIKTDVSKKTAKQLFEEFLREMNFEQESSSFKQGVLELCRDIVNKEDRAKGVYYFILWYKQLLDKQGVEPSWEEL